MPLLRAVMRDPHVALDMRVKMALKALPHLHRKLRAGEPASGAGDERLSVRPRKKLSPEAQRADELSIVSPINQAVGVKSDGATLNKGQKQRSVTEASVAPAGASIR
jgi:hypothetical protein